MEEVYLKVQLPSNGVQYGDHSGEVEIRTLKGKDERIISEMSLSNFESKFLLLMKNTVRGINPEILTLGDRLYILLWQAINTYSNVYKLRDVTCQSCLSELTVNVDLKTVEVLTIDEWVSTVKLKDLGEEVDLRLLTVMQQIDVDENDGDWVRMYAHTLHKPEMTIQEKMDFYENLSARDTQEIRAFQQKHIHGPKLETEFKCPECGGVGKTSIPFRLGLLFPYGDALIDIDGHEV